ncbi:hypothetical protein BEL04_18170 [Mucilaginibacter sp. PPCGB 2223]|uniref:type IV secretory system conjugative DNA transfer family protein n=1 Tax=Mucilaginibacter sp. PPCGB 2223 TaxID=1886027 RepID=UPI00082579CC|nr:TraM recognition domain-containing protein [Mucilaginibacter sp. PPCGB 2223]OCX51928.1 hypothetical protein BEL04_18170 [Mucilaginibacter sp. PPCGB 2223]
MKEQNKINLDMPLMRFGDGFGSNNWTLRDACCGTAVFGATGAGKTSSSGRKIAMAFLNNGFGGLVLTAKIEDKETFLQYCIEAGREHDLIVIDPDVANGHRFNFLEYESMLSDGNKALTTNIVELLMTVIEASSQKMGGTSDDGFWVAAVRMLIANVIDLCSLAFGKVTVENIYNIVQSLPEPEIPTVKGNEGKEAKEPTAFELAYALAAKNVHAQVDKWKATNISNPDLKITDLQSFTKAVNDALPDARIFSFLAEYFYRSLKSLSPKTKSVITYTVSGFLYNLLREPIYSLFCNRSSTVVPEDCFHGKIILINLPVKRYHNVGKSCQMIVKYCWQRAMEKRKITDRPLPVFLFADEAQHFVFESDSEFQATARSSWICNVVLTQNLPNFYVAMGSDKTEYRVKSLLGNFGTKIFHANTCIETNKWASDLIGEAEVFNPSNSYGFTTKEVNRGTSEALQLKKVVRPEDFVRLKTGGPQNNYMVQAIIHRQGKPFPDGENYKRLTFYQHQNSSNNSL